MNDAQDRIQKLEAKLEQLTTEFEQQMRARGFNPEQAEHVALPTVLAHLYAERLALIEKLDEIRSGLTMTEVERIADQFERAFNGQAWHGPSVLALLEGITAAQAAARPVTGAHSIWELTLHIAAWESAGARRLQGERAQLSDEEDWPRIENASEAAWERTKQKLRDNHQTLMKAIASVDESKLDRPIIEDSETPFSTVYVTLHGIVQHDLYHAGQIAILKKALEGVAS